MTENFKKAAQIIKQPFSFSSLIRLKIRFTSQPYKFRRSTSLAFAAEEGGPMNKGAEGSDHQLPDTSKNPAVVPMRNGIVIDVVYQVTHLRHVHDSRSADVDKRNTIDRR